MFYGGQKAWGTKGLGGKRATAPSPVLAQGDHWCGGGGLGGSYMYLCIYVHFLHLFIIDLLRSTFTCYLLYPVFCNGHPGPLTLPIL